MTLEHDLLQLALGAIRALMNGRNFGTGQTGHYLNIISRIDDELSRPKNEFYPDWDMIQPYHDRIAELETALAQPEQVITPISPDQYERLCFTCGACTGKPWVGLTDEDMHIIHDDAFVKNVDDIEWALQMVRRIEAKLKEKNNG